MKSLGILKKCPIFAKTIEKLIVMDKISILVPCCNVEKYVRECLDSIKAQTYQNLEIICINDGSKDSTGDIIDEYVAADKRFSAIHKPNSGYGDSMNKGLERCTGDYIGIVESDDWIEPDMFETLLNAAKAHDLDLVRCGWCEGPTGTERVELQDWVKKNVVCTPLDDDEIFLQQPSIWVSLYRRDILEEGRKVRFLPTPGASYQDTSFAFKVYTKSKRFMMLDKALHHYRVNPNSSVSSSGKLFCINDEWEEMMRWVCGDPELQKRFARTPLLPRICEGGMMWNYNRLSTTVAKLLFLRRASKFFRSATEAGIFNLHSFGKRQGGKRVARVMESPLDFHRDNITKRLKAISKYEDYSLKGENSAQDLISVVITCYNTSKYIYSSLMSVMQQSYKNLEIICVDDCSTDDTKMLVHHLMRKDKRIVWLCTEKNSGPSATRNLTLGHCHGKYIAFLDGDDCMLPGAIACMYDKLDDNIDAVFGNTVISYEEGEEAYGALVESDRNYYAVKENGSFNALEETEKANKVHVSVWGKLWRLSVIKDNKICFPDGLLYEDFCFYWQYLVVAPRVYVTKTPVCLYQRHHVGSIMSDTFKRDSGMAIQHVLILRNIYQFACERGLEKEIERILKKLYEQTFWFSYKNTPKKYHSVLFENMCNILKEQKVDTSKSPLLNYLAKYEDITKDEIFMKAFGFAENEDGATSQTVFRLSKKLRKYRKLTKILAILSSVLLILLVLALFVF